jgi:transposase
MLSRVEASFRSLKSELSIRPIYHRIDRRIRGHVFTTLLAYHLLCVVQKTLHSQGIHYSWKTIRNFMKSHARVTTTMTTRNNKTIYVRLASQPEEFHMEIYDALGISLKSLQRIKKIR